MRLGKYFSKIALSAASVITALSSLTLVASEPDIVILTPENAVNFGIDFNKAEMNLGQNVTKEKQKYIAARFHEEGNEIDLSSLDGISVTIDSKLVSIAPHNFESGGN